MTLFETIAAFAVAAILAALISTFKPRLLADLRSFRFWAALMAFAALISAVSTLVGKTRHAGTGFTTSDGWPKPFYFSFLGEDGLRTSDFEPLYFFGNSLFYSAILLIVWSAWRLMRK